MKTRPMSEFFFDVRRFLCKEVVKQRTWQQLGSKVRRRQADMGDRSVYVAHSEWRHPKSRWLGFIHPGVLCGTRVLCSGEEEFKKSIRDGECTSPFVTSCSGLKVDVPAPLESFTRIL